MERDLGGTNIEAETEDVSEDIRISCEETLKHAFVGETARLKHTGLYSISRVLGIVS
ncbi:hypothetical protein [Pyrodictium abyssi]|uniref:Uncharacterized protein n=1 Tax=Pyrodictium abyssi TaxID=54256 RepID=A0ABM8IZB3_9CREN|nr:hypothetical protein PABY_24510 [Pyrodictium abyssi]